MSRAKEEAILSAGADDRSFWRGEIVFDRRRTDILSDPLVVVDAELVTLAHLRHRDRKTYNAVKHNDTNKQLNRGHELPPETRCVRCSFLDAREDRPVVETQSYTYPTFRLARLYASDDASIPPFRPTMLAAAELIHHLEDAADNGGINSADELQVALMDADVDGEIIAAAAQLAKTDSKW